MYKSSTVREDQLQGLIEGLLNLVMTKEKKAGFKAPTGLVEKMTKALMEQNHGKELSQDVVSKDDFVNKLILCIKASVAANNSLDKKGQGIDDIISGVLENENIPKLSPKELQKLLEDPKAMEKFIEDNVSKDKANIITIALRDLAKKLTGDMNKLDMKPKPGTKAKQIEDDMYCNLLGLTCSAVAGGHQVTLASFIGNYVAIPDLNPNDAGMDNLSRINSYQDTKFGDPLSLNHIAEKRMDAIGDPTLEADISHLKNSHGIHNNTPRPIPNGH